MTNLWKSFSAVLCGGALFALVGCGGVSVPPVNVLPGSPTITGATNATVYVIQNGTANYSDQILSFAPGTSGSTTPTSTLTTNLSLIAVAVDNSGQIYGAGVNATTGAFLVNVYAAGSSGTATPTNTITLAAQPVALATDSAGSLYVTDTSGEIVVYSSGATTPTRTIAGALTAIGIPQGIAVDSAGSIYLASYAQSTGTGSILVFAPGASGNIAPSSTLLAPSASVFVGVAVDSGKNIYATTDSTGSSDISTVVEYAAGSSGSAVPLKTITGSSTLLASGSSDVGGIELDSAGNIYLPLEVQNVTNTYSYSLLEFAASANGNVAPYARFYSSSWTSAAAQIAVH